MASTFSSMANRTLGKFKASPTPDACKISQVNDGRTAKSKLSMDEISALAIDIRDNNDDLKKD